MHVVITGGAGFIGSNIAARLVEEGHTVTVLDDLSTGQRGRLASIEVEVIDGDVRSFATVEKSVNNADAIFHLAAVVGVPYAMKHRWDSVTTNILGTYNLLTVARRRDIPVFIASSSAIYGKLSQSTPVVETDDVMIGNTHIASWTYSYAKLAEEQLALAAVQEWSASVKIGRFFNVIGPGQSGAYGMVVPRFVTRALRGERLPVYGDGTQTRTFADIEDVVSAVMTVWERGEWGAVYNIGGQEEVSINDLAHRIIHKTQSRSTIQHVAYDKVFGTGFEEPTRRRPSTAKLQALGYTPRYTLNDTIIRVVASMREKAGDLRP